MREHACKGGQTAQDMDEEERSKNLTSEERTKEREDAWIKRSKYWGGMKDNWTE
jgi:hypothetical protein